MTRRWVVLGLLVVSLGVASSPAWAIVRPCDYPRELQQHLKILAAQLDETGKADPRLFGDMRAALAQMHGMLRKLQGDYQRATQAQGLKLLTELEGRLRAIEQDVTKLQQTPDPKAIQRLIPGLLKQLEAYGQTFQKLP